MVGLSTYSEKPYYALDPRRLRTFPCVAFEIVPARIVVLTLVLSSPFKQDGRALPPNRYCAALGHRIPSCTTRGMRPLSVGYNSLMGAVRGDIFSGKGTYARIGVCVCV